MNKAKAQQLEPPVNIINNIDMRLKKAGKTIK